MTCIRAAQIQKPQSLLDGWQLGSVSPPLVDYAQRRSVLAVKPKPTCKGAAAHKAAPTRRKMSTRKKVPTRRKKPTPKKKPRKVASKRPPPPRKRPPSPQPLTPANHGLRGNQTSCKVLDAGNFLVHWKVRTGRSWKICGGACADR